MAASGILRMNVVLLLGLRQFGHAFQKNAEIESLESVHPKPKAKKHDEGPTFDEAGYQVVASRKSNLHMNSFIRDVIMAHGGKITDKDALHGLVPFYSGVDGLQNFSYLQAELARAPWIDVNTSHTTFDEAGYQSVAFWKSNSKMNLFIREMVNAHSGMITNKDAFKDLVPYYSGVAGMQNFSHLHEELALAPWIDIDKDVSFDEVGYQAVAWWKSNAKMNAFIRNAIMAHDGKIIDKDALHGIVPFYSGISGVQNYKTLHEELARAPWIEKADWTKEPKVTKKKHNKHQKDKPEEEEKKEKQGILSWLR